MTKAIETERVIITKPMVGAVHMQVCAVNDATDEEILAVCNRENWSGTQNGWATVCRSDDEFWGKVGPVPCADNPERTHFIVAC
jgi:hypothetical protein